MTNARNQFNLSQWLAWVEQMHPAEIELGLDRIKHVFDRLKLEFKSTCLVTVAGTNGKGSTISYLESILQCAGYRTAAYTSPHFIRYNERIRLGMKEATDAQLCEAFCAIDDLRDDTSLTYFEWGTLVGLWLIAQEAPDVALLEVGLGGRLDAINIIDTDIAIVTSIGIDHVDWLGDDLAVIAVEKAGIARAGKPLICGAEPVPSSLADFATALGAPLYQKGVHFSSETDGEQWMWQSGNIQYTGLPVPHLPLPNASTVLQALQFIHLDIREEHIRQGLVEAKMTGRMQRIELPEGECILDVAHNPQAAALLTERLAAYKGKVQVVLAMLADKDIASVIDQLAPLSCHWHLASLEGPRAQTATALASHFEDVTAVSCFDNVAGALVNARSKLASDELILVAGSFFTVAAALEALEMDR